MKARFLAALLLAIAAHAGAASAPDSPWLPTTFGVNEGLPQHVVGAVLQARSGDIWCGTYYGLARFDGTKFTCFDEYSAPAIPSRRVTLLYEDSRGQIWTGSDSGAVGLVTDRLPQAGVNRLPGNQAGVLALGEDRHGEMWALTRLRELVRLRDGRRFPLGPEIESSEPELNLTRGPAGDLWLVHRGGIGRVENGAVEPVPELARATIGQVQRAVAGPSGLWIVADGALWRWRAGAPPERLEAPWVTQGLGEDLANAGSFVTALRELRDGRLAIAMMQTGVYLGVPNGTMEHLRPQPGLALEWIRSIAEDTEGNVWLGSSGNGLIGLHRRRVAMVPPEVVAANVKSISPGLDGDIWVGTEGRGVVRLPADGPPERFGRESGLTGIFLWSMLADGQGEVWAGGWDGTLHHRRSGRFEVESGPNGHPLTVLFKDHTGALWAGGPGPMRRRAPDGVWTEQDAEGRPWAPPGSACITESADGSLWIGGSDGRLLRRSGTQTTLFDQSHGLSARAINTLVADGDAVWLGTMGGGLYRVRGGRVTALGDRLGLPSPVISQLLIADGQLWVGTYRGICRLPLAAAHAVANGGLVRTSPLVFTQSDGMTSIECTKGGQPAACQSRDGRLWFPTNQGIAVVDPSTVKINPLPPPVYLESATVDGQVRHLGSAPVLLPPGTGRLDLAFTALSYTAPDRVRFRYRLRGMDDDWRDNGSERHVTYHFLPPGRYTFEVQACNNDGVWCLQPVAQQFTALPHFWQTLPFRLLAGALAVAAVVSAVWLVARQRQRARLAGFERLHALHGERARIARDMHDNLGASVTRLRIDAELASRDLTADTGQVRARLGQLLADSREMMFSLSQLVWSVDPGKDSLEHLLTHLGSTAVSLFHDSGKTCRLDLPTEVPHVGLSSDLRHNVVLAVREALHNALKHTAPGHGVTLAARLATPGLQISVADTGTGFDPRSVGRKNGLENLAARMRAIGGECRIQSHPGSPTRVEFAIPLPAFPLP